MWIHLKRKVIKYTKQLTEIEQLANFSSISRGRNTCLNNPFKCFHTSPASCPQKVVICETSCYCHWSIISYSRSKETVIVSHIGLTKIRRINTTMKIKWANYLRLARTWPNNKWIITMEFHVCGKGFMLSVIGMCKI